ncbi:MAG: hypothetical protein JO220_16240 [Hyphomicrobiales bacterium]|nr:hypothetical protein [Hyphomicrobiales bacterium]
MPTTSCRKLSCACIGPSRKRRSDRLNRLRDTRARREDYVGEWLPEPVLTGDEPAVRAEDVSFALLVVLERLSPLERVVFVLRNAFDLTFEEISRAVGRDVAACRKILSRARARVAQERPRFAVDRERHRQLTHGFLEATRAADMSRLVSLLADNVVFHETAAARRSPSRNQSSGARRSRAFSSRSRARCRPTRSSRKLSSMAPPASSAESAPAPWLPSCSTRTAIAFTRSLRSPTPTNSPRSCSARVRAGPNPGHGRH